MNVVLIGYRGTGKSEVGAELARRLGRELVNMDAAIVATAGKSIPEIVAESGWEHFRDLETAEAEKLSGRDGLVVDCGGGVIEREQNLAILRHNARVFWLQAEVATIVKRIEGDNQRPALTEGKSFTEEVAEVLERRSPKYAQAAHCVIATDPLTPQQVVQLILEDLSAQ